MTRAPVRRNDKTRRGALSKSDKEVIQQWVSIKSEDEIARILNKPIKQVQAYKKEFLVGAPSLTVERTEAEELRRELHNYPSWVAIQQQFSNIELVFYENFYIEYKKQFADMTATELKQLEHLITLEIFMHRHNVDRMDNLTEIERVEKLLKREYEKSGFRTPEELHTIHQLEAIVQSSRNAAANKTKEYQVLLEKHGAILKDLKGTRSERIKNLEDRGKFITILKELEVAERRKGVEEIVGLMDLATAKETKRLAKPFQYADSMIDQPLLNHETYKGDPEIEEDDLE